MEVSRRGQQEPGGGPCAGEPRMVRGVSRPPRTPALTGRVPLPHYPSLTPRVVRLSPLVPPAILQTCSLPLVGLFPVARPRSPVPWFPVPRPGVAPHDPQYSSAGVVLICFPSLNTPSPKFPFFSPDPVLSPLVSLSSPGPFLRGCLAYTPSPPVHVLSGLMR